MVCAVQNCAAQCFNQFVSIPRIGRIDWSRQGHCFGNIVFTHAGIPTKITAGQDHTTQSTQSVNIVTLTVNNANNHTFFDHQFLNPALGPDINTNSTRIAPKVVDISPGIGQHVVHTGFSVRGLLQGAMKDHAHGHQPSERITDVINQYAPQSQIVWQPRFLAKKSQVFKMIFGTVLNAQSHLMRGIGGADGAHRPCSGTTQFWILFEQNHSPR